jgi:hypothetical protein
MKTKICFRCKLIKKLINFYTDRRAKDGKNGSCKSCMRAKGVEWYRSNTDIYKEKYESIKDMEEYKEQHRKSVAKNIKNNKEKQKARKEAIKLGLPTSGQCSMCEQDGRLEKHHEDYSKPLEVVLLCSTCHKNLHKLYRDEKGTK